MGFHCTGACGAGAAAGGGGGGLTSIRGEVGCGPLAGRGDGLLLLGGVRGGGGGMAPGTSLSAPSLPAVPSACSLVASTSPCSFLPKPGKVVLPPMP